MNDLSAADSEVGRFGFLRGPNQGETGMYALTTYASRSGFECFENENEWFRKRKWCVSKNPYLQQHG